MLRKLDASNFLWHSEKKTSSDNEILFNRIFIFKKNFLIRYFCITTLRSLAVALLKDSNWMGEQINTNLCDSHLENQSYWPDPANTSKLPQFPDATMCDIHVNQAGDHCSSANWRQATSVMTVSDTTSSLVRNQLPETAMQLRSHPTHADDAENVPRWGLLKEESAAIPKDSEQSNETSEKHNCHTYSKQTTKPQEASTTQQHRRNALQKPHSTK
jgi:hypothetical protein